MRFQSVRPSRGIAAAQAVSGSMNRMYGASLDASPNFTELAKTAIEAKSQERRAAMNAEADVASAGLGALTDVNIEKQDANLRGELSDIRKPARRMAGLVGALGLGAGYMVAARNMKLDREAADKRDAESKANMERMLAAIEASKTPPIVLTPDRQVDMPDLQEIPEATPIPPSTDSGSPAPQSTGEVSDVGGSATPAQMVAYTMNKHGATKAQAVGLITNGIRESNLLTTNPGDGGYSNGIFQWNSGRLTKARQALGNNWNNWQAQIDYALAEPGEPGQQYLQTDFGEDYQAASDWWMRRWERPAPPRS